MADKDLTGLGEINALLGRGTEYEGKLTFDGRVRIEGRFKGAIFSDDVLILGEGAVVEATVEVGTLIVRGGRLKGEVKASHLVEIHAPGQVQGDIETPQIFIDKGVVFDGKCTMPDGAASEVLSIHDDSSALAERPEAQSTAQPSAPTISTPLSEPELAGSGAAPRKSSP
jgi:cytoskeletal protein CcmA (bactofilin family)